MQINTSTAQSLNISKSPTDIQFNVVRNNYTYASITGKVTSGGTTYYSWTGMLPGSTGGLVLAPQLGGGTITPRVADPAVQLNEAVPLAVGQTVLMRRRCDSVAFGSIWEVIFVKPKDKSTSGVLPGEYEPVLCTWSGFVFDAPTYVGGYSSAPNGSSFVLDAGYVYAAHKYWFLPKVLGPYGVYYLDTDPWGIVYWAMGSRGARYTAGVNASLGYTLPVQCIVYNTTPNLPKPFQYNIEVYRTTSPWYWFISGSTAGVADLNSAAKYNIYPSSCVTSNYKLLPADIVRGPSGSFGIYPYVSQAYYQQINDPYSAAVSFQDMPSGQAGAGIGFIAQDPMRLGPKSLYQYVNGATALSVATRKDYTHTVRNDYIAYDRTGWPTNEPLHDPVFSRFTLTQLGPDPYAPTIGGSN